MLFFSGFRMDIAEEQLWRSDKPVTLRRKPFAILKYLSANPRRLVTHAELVETVWGGLAVSDSAVRTHLHELRQVLGEGLIETVIGRGYRFTAETAGAAAAEPASEELTIVGREAELVALHAALQRAHGGHRQVWFVTGEPGIGKSTLVDAFAGQIDGRADVVVVRGSCVEQRTTPEAFLPVIEILTQLRRSSIGDVALASLIRHAPTFLAQLPHLIPDAQHDEVMRRGRSGTDGRSARELIEALEAMATNHTVVLVFEDLQWADVATIDLISLLGQRRERARLLVLATSRRSEAQTISHPLNHVMRNLIARFGAGSLPLDPITNVEIRRLVDLRFPSHAFPSNLAETISRITGGTPLFVVSFLEDLVGRGMLVLDDGRWQLTVSLDEVASHRPDSVRQLIDIHLDRLTPEEQRLLEAAAAVGIEFSTALVATALGASPESVDELCDSLARRALFLRRVGFEEWPDGTLAARYGVTHGLVQEVSVERSPPNRRQRWHQQIAERLELAYGDRASEVAHTLARQFDSAAVFARAVHYYMIAAARSTLLFASRDALALYERAHALIRRMPVSADRDALELTLLEGKTQSIIRNTAHSVRAPLEVFEQMIVLARRLGDADRLAITLANFRVRLVTLAEYDRADEIAAQLTALIETTAVPPAVHAIDTMGRILAATWRGDLRAAVELIERETSDPSQAGLTPGMIGPTDAKSIFIVQLSILHWLVGRTGAASAAVDRATGRATANGDPYMLGHAHCSLARLHFLNAESAQRIRSAAEAGLAIPDAEVWHPQCLILVGVADSAERVLTSQEIETLGELFRARSTEFPMGTTYLGLLFTTILLRSGQLDRALALLDELLVFARDRGEKIVEPELMRMRGVVLETRDRDAAAASYREAFDAAATQGSRAFQLRAALSLAALWSADPRRPQALELVAAALPHVIDETADVIEARRLLASFAN